MLPPVRNLLAQPLLLILVNVLEVLEIGGALRDQRPLLQQRQSVLGQALVALEALDILEELLAREALERVADLALEFLGEVRDGGAALGLFFGDGFFGAWVLAVVCVSFLLFPSRR